MARHAAAQGPNADTGLDWQHGTTLAGLVGVGGGPATTGTRLAAGAGVGWEISRRVGLEGRGIWFDTRGGSAFAALLASRLSLPTPKGAVPYVTAGVGMYRAAFEPGSDLPDFYRRRVDGATSSRRTFEDFALSVGGGAEIFVGGRHVALRPDVTVLLVTTQESWRAVPVYGVQFVYHFESHAMRP